MGNVCEFNYQQVITSFDSYDHKRISIYSGSHLSKNQDESHQRLFKDITLKQNLQQLEGKDIDSKKSIENQMSQWNYENQISHRISITPPSQRNIAMLKKLQQQSQVPSDFFQNVDFSLYFNTFKTLKENNFDQFRPSNNRLSTNRINHPSKMQSTNSLRECFEDQRIYRKDQACQNRKPSQIVKFQKENQTIQELKKTKMYLTQVQIKNN